MRAVALLSLATLLFAKVHTAKIEPYEIYTYKAAVAGRVLQSALSLEGKEIKNALVVQLDDRLDRAKLASLQKKLSAVQRSIELTKKSIINAQKILSIKEANYERIKDLKSKSLTEKERKLLDVLSARANLFGLKEKLQNLLSQKADISYAIEGVKDSIEKKHLRLSGYLYKVHIKRGDFAGVGAPLADIADVSRAKVIIYLSAQELEGIEHKKIYIDGKPSKAKFEVIEKITDPNYITQYRAKIILPKPKIFGKFIEVEIK